MTEHGSHDPSESRTAAGRFGYDPLAENLLAQQDERYRHVGGPNSFGAKALDMISRFRIILVVAAIAAVVAFVGLTDDSVRVSALEPGDCFEIVDRASRKRVTPIDCALPHGGETLADLDGLRSDALPSCQAELEQARDRALPSGVIVPSDARAAMIGGVILHRCVVLSDSGSLVGSLVSP